MPRFHINIHNGTGETRDEEGQDFPGLAEAERSAVEGVRSILREEVSSGTIDLSGRVEITNPAGEILSTIPFSEAVRLQGREST